MSCEERKGDLLYQLPASRSSLYARDLDPTSNWHGCPKEVEKKVRLECWLLEYYLWLGGCHPHSGATLGSAESYRLLVEAACDGHRRASGPLFPDALTTRRKRQHR